MIKKFMACVGVCIRKGNLWFCISILAGVVPAFAAPVYARPQPAQIPVIHIFRPNVPYQVNSYWFETPRGIVVMDFQRKLSLAGLLLRQVRATRKPVIALLVTHPHTDHVAGLGLFAQAYPGVPIYASAGTIDELRRDTQGYIKITQKIIGPDYPARIHIPNHVIHSGQTLSLGGVEFQTRHMGQSESKDATVFYLPSRRALFTGDLVTNSTDAFLLQGGSRAWIRQLDTLSRDYPQAQTLYPGHGRAGAPAVLIARQRRYLTTFRRLVRAQMDAGQWNGSKMTAQGKAAVSDEMKKQFPTFVLAAPIPDIVSLRVC